MAFCVANPDCSYEAIKDTQVFRADIPLFLIMLLIFVNSRPYSELGIRIFERAQQVIKSNSRGYISFTVTSFTYPIIICN